MISYFKQLPKDLEEAAYIDGASRLQTFLRVALPRVTPGLIATFLLAEKLGLEAYKLSSWDYNYLPLWRRIARLPGSPGAAVGASV